MEVKGVVTTVIPVQTGEGKNGMWKKQDYVIEYDQSSQYPRKMMFNLWGDKIDQYNIQEGQTLRVSFDIDCREYNGRWYNDIRAWKIEQEDGSIAPGQQFTDMSPAAAPEISPSDDSSDLPF